PGPVRLRPDREMMPHHHSLEPLSLGDPHNVHQLTFGKHAHRDGRADLRLARGTEFTHVPVHGQISLREVPLDRLGRLPVRQFLERQLDSGVPSRSFVLTCDTRQGPASITVTGTVCPPSRKTWVMPSFCPSNPLVIA